MVLLERITGWLEGHERRTDLLLIAVIALMACSRMVLSEDITFNDEGVYFRQGLELLLGIVPPFHDGPSYSALYASAHLLGGGPIVTYYIVRGLTAAMLVMSVGLAVRRARPKARGFYASMMLACTGVPYVWPGVSTFSAAALITGTSLLLHGRRRGHQMWAVILYWISAAARPEYTLAALFATAVILVRPRLSSNGRSLRDPVVLIVIAAMGLAIPLIVLSQSAGGQSERTWLAFGQHYSIDRVADHANEWESVMRADFSDANDLTGAVLGHPDTFALHVMRNIVRTPAAVAATILDLSRMGGSGLLSLLAVAGVLMGGVARLVRPWRELGDTSRRQQLGDRIAVLAPIGAMAASLASVLLIYPRQHYLVLMSAGIVLSAGASLDRARSGARMAQARNALMVALGTGLAVASVAAVISPTPMPNRAAVQVLRGRSDVVRVLTTNEGLAPYLVIVRPEELIGAGRDGFRGTPVPGRFEAVQLDGSLQSALIEDEALSGFLADPSRSGFSRVGASDFWRADDRSPQTPKVHPGTTLE